MDSSSKLMLGATLASIGVSLWSSASGSAPATGPDPAGSTRFDSTRIGSVAPARPRPSFPPERVCAVFESEFRTKGGGRTTIVVLDDGRRIDDERPIEAWGHHGWVRLSLASADRRRALVNGRNVVEASESIFRKVSRTTRNTNLDFAGGTQISVSEPIDVVRRLLGFAS